MKFFCFFLYFILFAISLSASDSISTDTDTMLISTTLTLKEKKGVNFNFIIPAVFISYGALAQTVKPFQQFDTYVDNEVHRHFKRRNFENYIVAIPAATSYGLDLVGVKAKHNFRDRTFVVLTSHLLMSGTVRIIKLTTDVQRPSNLTGHSFPSGHTGSAFTGAHILFKEYRDVSPWIGIAGYAVATTVGTMRILNRKHWFSDTITGAGIGILSAEVSYLLLPFFHRIIGEKETNTGLVIAPIVGNNRYGLGMVYVF